MTSKIPALIDPRVKLKSTGKIAVRNLDETTTSYVDIMDSTGNGIILGMDDDSLSIFRQVNGVQTLLMRLTQ